MTFDATVVQYAGIRECNGCETTSSSLDLKILEWATVDLQQTSQSPQEYSVEIGLQNTVLAESNTY